MKIPRGHLYIWADPKWAKIGQNAVFILYTRVKSHENQKFGDFIDMFNFVNKWLRRLIKYLLNFQRPVDS